MTPRIVHYAEVPDVAWANGGGTTRLMWGDAVGERRISVAMLDRPAPFSRLSGMARVLVVLDPIVVALRIGKQTRRLRRHDRIAFAGDDDVALIAIDRPGRVLNVMARADRWSPRLDADGGPIGWAAMDDAVVGGVIVRRGDLILDPQTSAGTIAIGFVRVGQGA